LDVLEPCVVLTAKVAQLKSSASPGGGRSVAAHVHGGAADGWSAEQHRALVRAHGIVPATLEPAARWARISELVPGKAALECAGMWKQLRALEKKRSAESAEPDTGGGGTAGGGGGELGRAAGAEARVAVASPPDEAAEAWTPRQQQQLEEALRRFPPKEASAWESAARYMVMAHA
jgi:hypothetical protein